MRKINFTETQIAEICASYLSGMTQAQLAKKYSVSQPTILKLLHKNEVSANERRLKKICKRGHQLADPNIYYQKVGRYTVRLCKACSNLSSKNYYERVIKKKATKP